MLSALVALSISYIIYGSLQQFSFIGSMLDSSQSFSFRLNRDINWLSGYLRFTEKPLLGHGLGGYYIEGMSQPGWGHYPHNLILELLSEMGMVGAMLFLLPLLLSWRILKKYSFTIRATNGGAVSLILIALFLQSMVSFDLRTSISVISVIGAILCLLKHHEKKVPLLKE